MRLFRVDFQNNVRPPILVRGVTRAQISVQMKERYGDLFLKVEYISHEDAEAQFGHFDLFKESRDSGRRRGQKLIPHTHAVVNTDAPKSRRIMSKHSSSEKADEYVKKTQPHIPGKLEVQSHVGKSTMTDYFNETKIKNTQTSKDKIMFKDQFKLAEISTNKIYKYLDKSGQEPGHKKDMESASSKRDKGFKLATDKVLGKAKVNATESNIDEISRDMKNRYIKKASASLYDKGVDQGISANDPNRFKPDNQVKLKDRMDKNRHSSIKRIAGIAKATEEFADFITPESELTEEMYFKVNIQGLPDMYMTASSAGMIKAKLRKMLKNMDMIGDIVKTPKADVRKAFRMKAMEGEDSQDESTIIEVKDGPKDTKLSPNTRALAKASDNRSRSTVIKAMNMNAPKDKAIAGRSYQEDNNLDEISSNLAGRAFSSAKNQTDYKKVTPTTAKKTVQMNKFVTYNQRKASDSKHVGTTDKRPGKNYNPYNTSSEPARKTANKQISDFKKKGYDVSEDVINNKIKFGKPSEEVFEQQDNEQDTTLVNFTSILTGNNPFYRPIEEISSKMSEGHDEIQDKNVDGLDDNQKPEGKKTAKQFPAPKDAKNKMKSLKMEMKSDVSDIVIEKAKLKKNDMKMRAGKLDPKAMTALKTMSQDEAKVLVQGLPSNLKKSTLKELGIKEKNINNTVDLILKKRDNERNDVTFNEDNMEQQQAQATKAYNDNKKSLQSLHRKAKSKGGQVHVDHTDEKGKKQSGRFNGMMRMGAHTYAKVEPHDGKRGATTLLPIHQAQNIRHVK